MTRLALFKLPTLLLLGFFLTGCATPYNRKDPLEPLNRAVFGFNEAVDNAILKPVAKGYKAVTPEPIEMMIGNFFSNLDDVLVTINDLLQLKFIEALSDSGRVLINSTVGLFGLVDVASAIGLEKRNEDFGQTLGRYGIASGPYLVLPLLGPSSLRDAIGRVADSKIDPLYRIDHISTRNRALALKFTDARARALDVEKTLEEAALDKYEFVRDAYLQRRRSLVHDGNPPRRKDDEEDLDESRLQDSSTLAATEPSTVESGKTAESVAVAEAEGAAAGTTATPDAAARTGDVPASRPDLVSAIETPPAPPKPMPMRIWLPVSNAY